KLVQNDGGRYISPYAVRVCYRMAKADLARAQRIADGIGSTDPSRVNSTKAQAYGAMAMALTEKDPAAARALLSRAFDQLASSRHDDWYLAQIAFPVAATLLGYSDTVDPERTREYFWRTLALHPGPVPNAWSPE